MTQVFNSEDHAINSAKTGVANDDGRQMKPLDDVFQEVVRLVIIANGAHDAAATFHGDEFVIGSHAVEAGNDHVLFHRIAF